MTNSELLTEIQNAITTNGNGEITGAILQAVLTEFINRNELKNEGLIQITATDAVILDGDAGVLITGNNSDVQLKANGAGNVKLTSLNNNVILKGSDGLGLPIYANDAAADADGDLQTGALYKTVAGGRSVYQKP